MRLPRPVRAVVFDMDGVLVDTEPVVFRAMQATARELGREMPFATFQRMVGLHHAHSERILVEHFGEGGFDPRAFGLEVSRRFQGEREAVGIALKPGVVELLDLLDLLALPRAIATSSSLHSVHQNLGPHGLLDRFHALVPRDVQTHGKPHPEPFLKAADALGVPPGDCLALEDSHNGVRAAAAAGMMTVMIPDLLAPTEEMRALCVRVASDLREVRELLASALGSGAPSR